MREGFWEDYGVVLGGLRKVLEVLGGGLGEGSERGSSNGMSTVLLICFSFLGSKFHQNWVMFGPTYGLG